MRTSWPAGRDAVPGRREEPGVPAPGSHPAAHLELDAVSRRYGATLAVERLSLSVQSGELVSLLGPSGCGKTTTLRMLAGFVAPTSGSIRIDGRDLAGVPPHRRHMGMVSQGFALFPHLDVAGNVAFGLRMTGVPRREARDRVAAALERVHLGGFGQRRIAELSGGQQQRVALARALVTEPAVLLLDEPLSNLDATLREQMRAEIRDIQRDLAITTIFVTHDQVEALTISDRVVVLNAGRIEQVDVPEAMYERPATRFVASFIGRANLLRGRVEASSNGRVRVATPVGPWDVEGAFAPGTSVTLMVRPHRLRLSTPTMSGDRRGRVVDVAYLGDSLRYDVWLGDARVTVDTPVGAIDAPRWSIGDEVSLSVDPRDVLAYADEP